MLSMIENLKAWHVNKITQKYYSSIIKMYARFILSTAVAESQNLKHFKTLALCATLSCPSIYIITKISWIYSTLVRVYIYIRKTVKTKEWTAQHKKKNLQQRLQRWFVLFVFNDHYIKADVRKRHFKYTRWMPYGNGNIYIYINYKVYENFLVLSFYAGLSWISWNFNAVNMKSHLTPRPLWSGGCANDPKYI